MKKPQSQGIHFGSYGPFILGRSGETVNAGDLKLFWTDVAKKHEGLDKAKGIYIASIRRGKNKELYPVYVGKTDSTYKKRLTDKHHLFELAKKYAPRRLRIFFLARMDSEEGPFTTEAHKIRDDGRNELLKLNSIERLEFMLIGECVRSGFPLLNTQQKAFHTSLNVAGFVGKTKAGDPKAARAIHSLLQSKKKLKNGVN